MATEARISQDPVEPVHKPDAEGHISQLPVEVTTTYDLAVRRARFSQAPLEVATVYDLPVRYARFSQAPVEVLRSFSCVDEEEPPVPPVTPTTEVRTLPIRRLRRAPHLCRELQPVRYAEFELELEAGVGLVTGQGEEPMLMLRWSNNGGATWSHEHWVSAGRLGAHDERAIWRRLGRGRDRIFELVVSDPVKWAFLSAFLRVGDA